MLPLLLFVVHDVATTKLLQFIVHVKFVVDRGRGCDAAAAAAADDDDDDDDGNDCYNDNDVSDGSAVVNSLMCRMLQSTSVPSGGCESDNPLDCEVPSAEPTMEPSPKVSRHMHPRTSGCV